MTIGTGHTWGEVLMMLMQRDTLLALRAGAPNLQKLPHSVAVRAQTNPNDRRSMPPPSMKPLSPMPGSSPGMSTSQVSQRPAAAPGVVVQQPVLQQAYAPSYRVSLFGECLNHCRRFHWYITSFSVSQFSLFIAGAFTCCVTKKGLLRPDM